MLRFAAINDESKVDANASINTTEAEEAFNKKL